MPRAWSARATSGSAFGSFLGGIGSTPASACPIVESAPKRKRWTCTLLNKTRMMKVRGAFAAAGLRDVRDVELLPSPRTQVVKLTGSCPV